jgi:Proteasome subunit
MRLAVDRLTEHRLFHINVDGNSSEETYKIIGSGEKTADMFLKKQVSELTMKDCAKYAYLAIMYMDQYCPGLGVGVEPDHTPDIMYIAQDKTTQHPAPPGDILEFKKFTEERLEQFRLSFDKIIKE